MARMHQSSWIPRKKFRFLSRLFQDASSSLDDSFHLILSGTPRMDLHRLSFLDLQSLAFVILLEIPVMFPSQILLPQTLCVRD